MLAADGCEIGGWMAKRALLVGINEYRRVNGLRGCVNDVTNLRMVLKQHRGFTNDEIRVLTDSRATKVAIQHRLSWLVQDAMPGDFLLFHFSGHGSQIRDRDLQDELFDGLDEILCPYDMDWDGTFITDDDLRARLVVPAGVAMEVVLDCCHAGGSEDEEDATAPSAERTGDLARFLKPPIDIASRHEGERLPFHSRLMRSLETSSAVTWAACGAGQTSTDALINRVPWGAFTHALCSQMRQHNGALARDKLLELVRGSLTAGGYAQTPEVDADSAALAAQAFGDSL
jgi:hypothetical protein